jgi:putative oxidoreductase
MRDLLTRASLAGPTTAFRANAAPLARLGAGAVFVAFGAGKFASHASEVASFRTYGLPAPGAFVYAIGVVEILGGALLIAGLATRLASLVLSGDMLGAIIVSGIVRGEVISLTLAPAQLTAMLFLLWTGPGRFAIDRRGHHARRLRRWCARVWERRLHRTARTRSSRRS